MATTFSPGVSTISWEVGASASPVACPAAVADSFLVLLLELEDADRSAVSRVLIFRRLLLLNFNADAVDCCVYNLDTNGDARLLLFLHSINDNEVGFIIA